MQGSAPLKSNAVFGAYLRLSEAFVRNELHDQNPIFSFVLSSEAETYLSYLVERLSFLRQKGSNNAEKQAYLNNDASNVARSLDMQLKRSAPKKRTRSVSKTYKSSLLLVLNSGDVSEHGISDEVANEAVKILSNEEIIQTFSLLSDLHLSDIEQFNAVYHTARERYRRANAHASEAHNSEEKTHFKFSNLCRYLSLIGFKDIISKTATLDSKMLFKLRNLPSMKEMNNVYFECQDQDDIDALLSTLQEFKINGKIRSLFKHSSGAVVAYFFESLNHADIGKKALNKALEHLAKMFFCDLSEEVFAQKIYAIYATAETLEKEIIGLTNKRSMGSA
jgi:hypothetical protein